MLQRFSQYFDKLSELVSARVPFVAVTLVQSRGHTPQGVGAKAFVGAGGLLAGTVGGGLIEARAVAHAQALLAREPAPGEAPVLHDFVTWNLQHDVKMSCGGEVSFFFEVVFRHEWQITVFGAGHVAQHLVPILLTLDCSVTCLDTRPEWIERLPQSPKLRSRLVKDLAAEAPGVAREAFVLLVTQGHGHDVPILQKLFELSPEWRYLGVIGSDLKARALGKELLALGIAAKSCELIRCPMGLPIGTNDPAEIAISIAGELIGVRDRLRGTSWEAK